MDNIRRDKGISLIKPKLAICIPAYNNSEHINDILIEELPFYRDNNFFLYILDSSEGNAIKNLCSKHVTENDNLQYFSFPSDIHSNRKVYHVDTLGCYSCRQRIVKSTAVLFGQGI